MFTVISLSTIHHPPFHGIYLGLYNTWTPFKDGKSHAILRNERWDAARFLSVMPTLQHNGISSMTQQQMLYSKQSNQVTTTTAFQVSDYTRLTALTIGVFVSMTCRHSLANRCTTHLEICRAGTLKIVDFLLSPLKMANAGIRKENSQHIDPGLAKEKGTAFGKEADLLRDLLLLIHIDLTELDCAVRVQVREIFNDRGDEFAWSTPPISRRRRRRRRLCPSGSDKRRLSSVIEGGVN